MKFLFIGAIILVLPISWIVNAYKLTQCDFEPAYKEEVLRVIAIPIAPLSIIVAWIDFEDKPTTK